MVPHACARCGKLLDSSSRVFSSETRLWVATCPRCGFAARWNLRAARAPFRLWARARALNLRMGIALTCGQLAGGGVVGIVAMVAESRLRLKQFETRGIGLDPEWLAGLGILIGVAAVLAALSATAMAPTCRAPIRWLLAWTIGALPVAIGLLAIVTASGTLNPMPWRRTPQTGIIAILLALAATLFLSFILAIAFNLIYARLQRSAARKYRRKHEQSVRGLSGVLLRPQVMQVPSL